MHVFGLMIAYCYILLVVVSAFLFVYYVYYTVHK